MPYHLTLKKAIGFILMVINIYLQNQLSRLGFRACSISVNPIPFIPFPLQRGRGGFFLKRDFVPLRLSSLIYTLPKESERGYRERGKASLLTYIPLPL
jgi:hypothetical protein